MAKKYSIANEAFNSQLANVWPKYIFLVHPTFGVIGNILSFRKRLEDATTLSHVLYRLGGGSERVGSLLQTLVIHSLLRRVIPCET